MALGQRNATRAHNGQWQARRSRTTRKRNDAGSGSDPVRREDGKIRHFWGTETMANHVDTVCAYWNLMDFTPEGRSDIQTPPQNFRSEFLERHCLAK